MLLVTWEPFIFTSQFFPFLTIRSFLFSYLFYLSCWCLCLQLACFFLSYPVTSITNILLFNLLKNIRAWCFLYIQAHLYYMLICNNTIMCIFWWCFCAHLPLCSVFSPVSGTFPVILQLPNGQTMPVAIPATIASSSVHIPTAIPVCLHKFYSVKYMFSFNQM